MFLSPILCKPPALSSRHSGSVLLLVVIILFVFMTAYMAFAGSQVLHAKRLVSDYGKLQAVYAAESAVYASFAKKADVAAGTSLYADGTRSAQYGATRETALDPTWITGTGTAVVNNSTYTATVRGFSTGSQIIMWEFDDQ